MNRTQKEYIISAARTIKNAGIENIETQALQTIEKCIEDTKEKIKRNLDGFIIHTRKSGKEIFNELETIIDNAEITGV